MPSQLWDKLTLACRDSCGQKLKEELTNVVVIVVTGYCLFVGAEVIAYEQRLCYCWHGRVIPRATCLLQSFSSSPCSSGKRLSGKMVMGIPLSLTLRCRTILSLYMLRNTMKHELAETAEGDPIVI